ncbi:MAG: S8 family peptidase [Clostridium sp.]
MRHHKCISVISAVLLFAGIVTGIFFCADEALAEESSVICTSEEDGQVQRFSLSPGYPALPYSDPYSDYQWAFLNNGIFKLVPNKKVNTAEPFEGKADGSTLGEGPANEIHGTTLAVPGIDINMVPAWETYKKKENKRQVIVAIVDTGIDYSHEDLWNSVWVNADEIPGDHKDNDGNGYIDDLYGWNFYSNNNQVYVGKEDSHGTHSAGTIAASHNGKGMIGINDSNYVKVMAVKVLGTTEGIGSPENVVKGIHYAEENGAVICNLSFGTAKYSEELYQAMKNSHMLFVVAAGNGDQAEQGYNIDERPIYPASFDLDNIISVANLKFDGTLDSGSNFGVKTVDLAAPGNYILSTMPQNGYGYMSGTSMAAPMVTGAAAMMYSYDPELQIGDIKTKILSTTRKLKNLSDKVATGGMLNVSAALE